jgi:hypothetical protein
MDPPELMMRKMRRDRFAEVSIAILGFKHDGTFRTAWTYRGDPYPPRG